MAYPNLGKVLSLGDRCYCATANKFKGEIKIHVRKYYEPKPEPGEAPPFLPTKYGVALKVKEWNDLQKYAPQLNAMVEELEREQEEFDNKKDEVYNEMKSKRLVNQKPYDRNKPYSCKNETYM